MLNNNWRIRNVQIGLSGVNSVLFWPVPFFLGVLPALISDMQIHPSTFILDWGPCVPCVKY